LTDNKKSFKIKLHQEKEQIKMNEIKVWVGDLAEYVAGNLIGEWFTLPCDLNEIFEEVLTNIDHEYFVADYECDFDIDGYSLRQINDLAEMLESVSEYDQKAMIAILDSGHTSDINEALEIINNGAYSVYPDCKDMSDVAYEFYEQTGMLQELEKHIASYYIDFDAIGRDMEINGYFYYVDGDYIEIHN
jgi:antirestriction protein